MPTEKWPAPSQEAANRITSKYGEPDESTPSMLVWHGNGPWRRTVVLRDPIPHAFPKPHDDVVEQTVEYRVPPGKASEIAAFDGSVIVDRTAGRLSARCHDEEANFLALNLAHDIVTGMRTADEARRFYVEAMLSYRRGEEVPYMRGLLFEQQAGAADPDKRAIGDEGVA